MAGKILPHSLCEASPHPQCSIYEDNFDKCTALDLIWSLTIKYIMDCHYKDEVARPRTALFTVLRMLRFFINAWSFHLISIYLKRNIRLLK